MSPISNVPIFLRKVNSGTQSLHAILQYMAESGSRRSCGAVVVRQTPEGVRFLLLRAFRHWDFPKGMLEAGEAPLDAAMREVEEETTLADLDFAWGTEYLETGPYSRGKIARYYLARTTTAEIELPVNPELGRPEHNEYRWVDYREALVLTTPRVRAVVKWAGRALHLAEG